MSLANETYILLAEKREGRSGSYGSVVPLFNDTERPEFLKSVSRFDDITLRPGGSLEVSSGRKGSYCFILPLAGSVDLLSPDDVVPVENGSWLEFRETGDSFHVYNPFDRPVNFLLIGHDPDQEADGPHFIQDKLELDNRLLPFHASAGFRIIVGHFGERESVEVPLYGPGLLAYVIEGIFEIKDRLLQSRDALSVPDTLFLDFECFTHGGLVLFICNNGVAA